LKIEFLIKKILRVHECRDLLTVNTMNGQFLRLFEIQVHKDYDTVFEDFSYKLLDFMDWNNLLQGI
jgi:hypothetical protein